MFGNGSACILSSPEYNLFSRFLCCTYKNIAQGCLQSIGLGSRVVWGGDLGDLENTPLSCRNIPKVPGQSIKEKPTVSPTKSRASEGQNWRPVLSPPTGPWQPRYQPLTACRPSRNSWRCSSWPCKWENTTPCRVIKRDNRILLLLLFYFHIQKDKTWNSSRFFLLSVGVWLLLHTGGKNYIHIGLFEDPVQSSSSKTPT